MYHGSFEIMRIGDSQNDELKIPNDLKKRITKITKCCTKPELEILLIINEGLYSQYLKVSSKESPKVFSKKNIVYRGKRYDNSTQFFIDYYENRVDSLYKTYASTKE